MNIVLLIISLIFSANPIDNTDTKSLEDKIVGKWQMHYVGEGQVSFQHVKNIAFDSAGIEFLSDGSVKVKQNAGWCATPPISYGVFDGTWNVQGEKLSYTYKYHDQPLKNELKFISGNERTLNFQVVYRAQATF